jgi:isopenicillin-N N-acyltransferase-like protein
MKKLLRESAGKINESKMKEIMSNRDHAPHTLSRDKRDHGSDVITFTSIIASPTTGEMWVAAGPPHEFEYHRYAFSN